MENIKDIKAEEIKDSRGNPTLRVEVYTQNSMGAFDVPSGASTGASEALEKRDQGGGMNEAIGLIGGEIKASLLGMDALEQRNIDQKLVSLDGTENKSRLGGNSLVGVSVATARAGADSQNLELYEYMQKISDVDFSSGNPRIFMNLINGGKHGLGGSPFQEHQIVLEGESIEEMLDKGKKVQEKLRELLGDREYSIGDEGGFVFKVRDVFEPFELLKQAVREAGLSEELSLGADIAGSSFYKDGKYSVLGKDLNTEELMEIYQKLFEDFNLKYLEDPFEENDFESFRKLREVMPDICVIGDDLTTTNPKLLKKAIENNSVDGLIIKVNQIGTLSECLETMKLAKDNNIKCIVSHRSGETMDSFIADLTRGTRAFGIKAGAWGRKEREVKYTRLVEIYK